jgi:hypothetical protein
MHMAIENQVYAILVEQWLVSKAEAVHNLEGATVCA